MTDRPTPAEVAELFRLDEATGRVYFRPRARHWFKSDQSCNTWNSRFAGQETFTFFDEAKREFTGCIFGKTVRRAMVAYCLAFGHWPAHRVGFHDDDKTNTRPDNLLAVRKRK